MKEDLKEFPCPNCNSELNYDANIESLKCLHCHSKFSIESSEALIVENSFSEIKNKSVNEQQPNTIIYDCSKCGTENNTTNNIVFFECKSCGNNVINTKAYKQNIIHPSAIIPFSISKENAINLFKDWIGKGFFTNSSLKKLALIDHLKGAYIPFWTFDANTETNWSGMAGYHYYETETYTDSDGETQTRSVQKTDWQFNSGSFTEFFDDILICGSNEVDQKEISKIYPFELESLIPLNEKYILGWSAKNYSLDIENSFAIAEEFINKELYSIALNELGGDVQTNVSVDSTIKDKTYKHIILPIWFCEYIFNHKKYSFIINGQTGKIQGTKPLSVSKIVAVVLTVLLVIALIVYFYNQQNDF